MEKYIFQLALIAVFALLVAGHGTLWTPVSRSSAWRKGWDTPKNWNDIELNCGGFGVRTYFITFLKPVCFLNITNL